MMFKSYSVFTDYNPSCSLNSFLQQKYKTGNSHEYRYFLQQNAEQLRTTFSECAQKEAKKCDYKNIQVTWKPNEFSLETQ